MNNFLSAGASVGAMSMRPPSPTFIVLLLVVFMMAYGVLGILSKTPTMGQLVQRCMLKQPCTEQTR